MPKVDLEAIEQINRTGYPPPFDEAGRRALVPAPRAGDRPHRLRRQPCRR